jgi:hypothetical protein
MSKLKLNAKVVIEKKVLKGSGDHATLQRFAMVYVGQQEYRILAPPGATGDPLEWISNWSVREPSRDSFGVEILVSAEEAKPIVVLVREKLENPQNDTQTSSGGSNGLYFHVRLYSKREPPIEAKFDLTVAELESRVHSSLPQSETNRHGWPHFRSRGHSENSNLPIRKTLHAVWRVVRHPF